jgi:hypothetical protein
MAMGVDEFERWWRVRERADIERMIGAVDVAASTPDADVCHVLACASLDVALRRTGRRREGCRAAHRVRVAVLDACRRTEVLETDHDGAVRLARAAGEAARAMVCGTPLPSLEELFHPFRSELALPQAS